MTKRFDSPSVAGDPSLGRYLKQAGREGRLPPDLACEAGLPAGESRCPVCGMWAATTEEARECCADLPVRNDFCDISHARRRAIDALAPRAGDAFAGVLYRDEFIAGLEHLMERHNCRTPETLSRCTDISASMIRRALAGGVSWIGRRNWNRLIVEFDGDVPGCEEGPFGE